MWNFKQIISYLLKLAGRPVSRIGPLHFVQMSLKAGDWVGRISSVRKNTQTESIDWVRISERCVIHRPSNLYFWVIQPNWNIGRGDRIFSSYIDRRVHGLCFSTRFEFIVPYFMQNCWNTEVYHVLFGGISVCLLFHTYSYCLNDFIVYDSSFWFEYPILIRWTRFISSSH